MRAIPGLIMLVCWIAAITCAFRDHVGHAMGWVLFGVLVVAVAQAAEETSDGE